MQNPSNEKEQPANRDQASDTGIEDRIAEIRTRVVSFFRDPRIAQYEPILYHAVLDLRDVLSALDAKDVQIRTQQAQIDMLKLLLSESRARAEHAEAALLQMREEITRIGAELPPRLPEHPRWSGIAARSEAIRGWAYLASNPQTGSLSQPAYARAEGSRMTPDLLLALRTLEQQWREDARAIDHGWVVVTKPEIMQCAYQLADVLTQYEKTQQDNGLLGSEACANAETERHDETTCNICAAEKRRRQERLDDIARWASESR